MARKKTSSSIMHRILSRIYGHGRGYVFTPDDFADLGNRSSVGWVLHELTADNKTQRIARGLYYLPRQDPELGTLSPTTQAIAQAIERKDQIKLCPSGAYAANLLGLSEQVPMKTVYLTDGPSRIINVGNQKITMKQITTKQLAPASQFSRLLIQALKSIGKESVPMSKLSRLAGRLSTKEREQLRSDARYAPAWIGSIMRGLSEVEESI